MERSSTADPSTFRRPESGLAVGTARVVVARTDGRIDGRRRSPEHQRSTPPTRSSKQNLLVGRQRVGVKARPSAEKRRKERDRQSRKREKAARVARRRAEQSKGPRQADGEDPDIAGIVPGPQPQAEGEVDSSQPSSVEDDAAMGAPASSRS